MDAFGPKGTLARAAQPVVWMENYGNDKAEAAETAAEENQEAIAARKPVRVGSP
jgi:hypothetical protein